MHVYDAFVYIAIYFVFLHIHIVSYVVEFNMDSLTICSENCHM